jgi:hypothetical protein
MDTNIAFLEHKVPLFSSAYMDNLDANASHILIICRKNELALEVFEVLRTDLSNHFEKISIDIITNIHYSTLPELEKVLDYCHSKYKIVIYLGCSDTEAHFLSQNELGTTIISNKIPSPFIEDKEMKKTFIGYQRHFSPLRLIQKLESFSPNSLSQGAVKAQSPYIEPIMRDTENLFVDLKVLSAVETGLPDFTFPTGINVQELCTLFRHVGTSPSLRRVYIKEIQDASQLNLKHMAKIVALSLWYLFEGVNLGYSDDPREAKPEDLQSYHMEIEDVDIQFIKNTLTGRMWLLAANNFHACSLDEYQAAANGNIPDRFRNILD